MAQSSYVDTQPTIFHSFGIFMIESLEAHPLQTFLILVSVFLLSIVGTSWFAVQWLELDPSKKASPEKQHLSSSSADTAEAKTSDTASRKEKQ